MSEKPEFKFEVNVSEACEGYIAASPQFKGLSAWGPSIEYAVLEFGFALHLHAETVVDNDETFERQNPLLPGSGRD